MSSPALYDVCAIGNALVDAIAETNDRFLQTHKIAKSAMTLVEAERAERLYAAARPAVEMSGGSAANTAVGIAMLGGNPAYMGKVKNDRLGGVFRSDMKASGVHYATPPAPDGPPTGHSLILVTPDGQRSMNTCLGAATEFGPGDIQPDIIANSHITFLEGYLFDKPAAKEAFRRAAKIAHDAGRKLALTLSDVSCVKRHHAEFLDLVKNDVDILFANQNELMALYKTDKLTAALSAAYRHCKPDAVIVTTRSEKGAVIVANSMVTEIPAEPVAKVVDTTGAGDSYAAGFLYGLTQGRDLAECGRLGAVCAAEVIGHYGARPRRSLKILVRRKAGSQTGAQPKP